MDEPALIQSAQHGDLDAFNSLVLAYQNNLFNTALRILNDEELAADATQDAFLSAFCSINTYRGGSFKAWLMRTVINACYDELRRKKRRPTIPLEPDVDGDEMCGALAVAGDGLGQIDAHLVERGARVTSEVPDRERGSHGRCSALGRPGMLISGRGTGACLI